MDRRYPISVSELGLSVLGLLGLGFWALVVVLAAGEARDDRTPASDITELFWFLFDGR